MDADSDLALLVHVARGDREAFASLYDRHAGMLLAIAQRILQERSAAEAVLHDVFLELWRSARELDPQRGSLRAWLAMRTRSRALDRHNAPGFPRREGDVSLEPLAAPTDGEVALTAERAEAEAVRRALLGLPDVERQALELGFFQGLSSAQIAERTDTPLGALRTRVAAALEKLRRTLQPSRTRGRAP